MTLPIGTAEERELPRLDEYDKSEWFDVMKHLHPGLSCVEFDELWTKFQGDNLKRAMQ